MILNRYICNDCGRRIENREVLDAPNPFDKAITIFGCPKCKCVNTLRTVCDEPGCWEPDTCGTPTPQGYRRTCEKHTPK